MPLNLEASLMMREMGYKGEFPQMLHWKSVNTNDGFDNPPWKEGGIWRLSCFYGPLPTDSMTQYASVLAPELLEALEFIESLGYPWGHDAGSKPYYCLRVDDDFTHIEADTPEALIVWVYGHWEASRKGG